MILCRVAGGKMSLESLKCSQQQKANIAGNSNGEVVYTKHKLEKNFSGFPGVNINGISNMKCRFLISKKGKSRIDRMVRIYYI